MKKNLFWHGLFVMAAGVLLLPGSLPAASHATTKPSDALQVVPGELVPSEDSVIKDLHCLGLIDGTTNVFRSACPVRDLVRKATTRPSDLAEARERMKHMYALGIRTIISFQDPAGPDTESKNSRPNEQAKAIDLEREAAAAEGLNFVNRPLYNSGPNSFENMTDAQVIQILDPIGAEILQDAKHGGIVFHCSAGHDRAGIMAAYLRIKVQHWSAEQAIAEMRRYGHNWPKFSDNGGKSSWHEDHLRAIAKILNPDGEAVASSLKTSAGSDDKSKTKAGD